MGEDRDIKIYVKGENSESNDFVRISDGIDRNKRNGNSDKAKQLGIRLAKVKPDSAELEAFCRNMPAAELYCVRVLLTFTAEFSIRNGIHSDILADAVSTSMYDYLKTEEKGYYDNISDGSAFTFYLLALKKDGNPSHNIGEQFAKRCGTNRIEYAQKGAEIFDRASELFSRMIEETGFEEI